MFVPLRVPGLVQKSHSGTVGKNRLALRCRLSHTAQQEQNSLDGINGETGLKQTAQPS
jgi:hypothetical protein